MLGDRIWWIPKWLDDILPDIDVEGHDAPIVESHRAERSDDELTPV